ncbi:hypothetical protein HYPSUDRAFT_39654 [Hypholoma sublateritium FD-334 SS-4]|uniref:Major facilitator superfamily (MFS) profile domain-containing protein n=1 Tax=Hypholoma sublateritium (strain FD-334 SS-4) TaxID=945553 RepID=A0A0D2MJF2_HYPSF|nr:hypothetical protein HYPSUDRAFT_39654 [Hypholoma sublateritium FD-334 SS-4]
MDVCCRWSGLDYSTLMAKDSIHSTRDATPHAGGYAEKGVIYLRSDELDSTIDPTAEKRLLRKLDYTLLPLFTLLYGLNFIDRTAIGLSANYLGRFDGG